MCSLLPYSLDSLTFWVRFTNQTEDQATRVYVPRQGIVDDLRAEIAKAFGLLRPSFDMKIGDTVRFSSALTYIQELTNNRQSLATLPQGTVVVTVRSPPQPTQGTFASSVHNLSRCANADRTGPGSFTGRTSKGAPGKRELEAQI